MQLSSTFLAQEMQQIATFEKQPRQRERKVIYEGKKTTVRFLAVKCPDAASPYGKMETVFCCGCWAINKAMQHVVLYT